MLDPAIILQEPDTLGSTLGALQKYQMSGVLIEHVDELLRGLRRYPGAHRRLIDEIRAPKSVRLVYGTARQPESLHACEVNAFTNVFPALYPSSKDRVDILKLKARSMELEPQVNFESIAERTEWWSGAELSELIENCSQRGVLSQELLNKEVNFIGERVVRGLRMARTQELLRFTMKYCTHKNEREELRSKYSSLIDETPDKPRAEPGGVWNVGSLVVQNVTEEIMGDKVKTGDVYGGVVGGHVHGVNFTQTWNQLGTKLRLSELAQQLSALRAELLKEAKAPEDFVAVGAIASAEMEAKKDCGSKALEYLSKAGKWAFDVATKTGETVAAEALKIALGLK
jgi:SpoVK/Ycf46/Vps4 family AAA+-type ATPase